VERPPHFAFAVAVAFALVVAVLVVIPEGDLLLSIFFRIFSPKNACQALKPLNPMKTKEINLAYLPLPTRYT
jgi:hypothetical protein